MSRRIVSVAGSIVMILSGCVVTAAAASASTVARSNHRLPADGPAALYRAEPKLPTPRDWPASNTAFSRTSGTGRYADGAFYWTDFLYDDHGTTTASGGGGAVAAGTPTFGTYIYPPGPSFNNGADIFRAAVALRKGASYWRVDWNTLADPKIPIAEWTFDRDDNAATGETNWAAKAGVHSPGIDTALVVSSRGAELINLASGKVIHLHTAVDRQAGSFVVRIPHKLLAPNGSWRIRLAAGLANATGTTFKPGADALPSQTHIYNVTFRSRAQEPIADDFWDDETQTGHLAVGNVAPFSRVIRWSQLRHRRRTPQPRPTGWSDRWYVSDVRPGYGLITDVATVSDGKANYLGRVQPYAIYVPTSYRPNRSAPLTFLLHSSNQNDNQYAATTPNFTKEACQQRRSICVSPLGRGPDGLYFGTAELDFWQVWHEVAQAYDVSPNHTVITGYSMGGIGANQIAMEHPDLFARSVTLAGGVGNIDSLVNLRWVPTYLAGGAEDELVPVNLQAGEADQLKTLGYRYRWIIVSAIDHVSYELADSFADAVHYMGHSTRVRRPGAIDFTWTPANTPPPNGVSVEQPPGIGWTQSKQLGVSTTGDYWLRHLHARSRKADASIVATSGERPDRSVTTHHAQGVDPTFAPDPAVITTQTWSRGARPARHPVLRLNLTNVRSLKVLLHMAGFTSHDHIRVIVTSDGPVNVRLGTADRRFAKGRHVVRFGA